MYLVKNIGMVNTIRNTLIIIGILYIKKVMINQLSAVFIGLKKLFKFYPNGCMQDPTNIEYTFLN